VKWECRNGCCKYAHQYQTGSVNSIIITGRDPGLTTLGFSAPVVFETREYWTSSGWNTATKLWSYPANPYLDSPQELGFYKITSDPNHFITNTFDIYIQPPFSTSGVPTVGNPIKGTCQVAVYGNLVQSGTTYTATPTHLVTVHSSRTFSCTQNPDCKFGRYGFPYVGTCAQSSLVDTKYPVNPDATVTFNIVYKYPSETRTTEQLIAETKSEPLTLAFPKLTSSNLDAYHYHADPALRIFPEVRTG